MALPDAKRRCPAICVEFGQFVLEVGRGKAYLCIQAIGVRQNLRMHASKTAAMVTAIYLLGRALSNSLRGLRGRLVVKLSHTLIVDVELFSVCCALRRRPCGESGQGSNQSLTEILFGSLRQSGDSQGDSHL